MMNLEDVIVAVSSPSPQLGRVCVSIIRISGAKTFALLEELFFWGPAAGRRRITHGTISIEGIRVPVILYSFRGPYSYTGQDLAELHITAAGPVVETMLEKLLSRARPAQPGEFTWRAYINGRMDLAGAEAVAQIVSGANAAQVTAAEKLLSGNLSKTIAAIRQEILYLLSRIEAGLDFVEEDIEFISAQQAAEVLESLTARLKEILDGTIQYERMIDLPCVGIAGAVNAGKSTLLNALLGRRRSMVSGRRATTRDVLHEILRLDDSDCVLFDCAGLAENPALDDPLDALAQQAARTALAESDMVLFCVDITKDDLSDDQSVRALLAGRPFLAVATHCDRVDETTTARRLEHLHRQFGCRFMPVSGRTGRGLTDLKESLQKMLCDLSGAGAEVDQRITVNERHQQILTEAAAALAEASSEIRQHHEEIAAMLLRNAWQRLGGIEREDVEEAVLEQIFSRFCVGK